YLDMITRKHSCTARDRNGKLCTGKPKLVRSKGTFAFSTFVGCSGWRIDFKQGHKSHPLTPNVQIDLLEKLMRGDASAVTQNDTPPCPTFVPPHVGNKQSHCFRHHIVNGKVSSRAAIVHHDCPARLWIFVPTNPELRVALALHGVTKQGALDVAHNHPVLAKAKACAVTRGQFAKAVDAANGIGMTAGKIVKASSTKDIMGGAPSGFHDSLANKRLIRDMVAKKVATDAPAGRSVPGVYDFMLQERNLPSTERYVHQVYTTTAVPMRVIIITYESSLLALIHQASFLDVDKSFKRTTELDEWEVSTFLRSHQTAITLARFYTDGADQAHFKKIFDMLRAEVQACTGRPLAFKRLSKNGTLLNFGMDMELAQILGAAESFLETNDPEFSGIHTSDPKELAQYMIRICRCHVMRPILELKREVTDEEYATLRQFPDLADSEALQKFEEFIGSLASPKLSPFLIDFLIAWFAHKKSNYYLIPMIAQSLSKIHPDDWVVNPATTNLGEGAHARTNRETGTNLPLLDGIKAARIFDREQARRIQQERSSGVLANRNAGLAVRMKNNSTRAEKARARAAEAQEQQDQEHILKAKIEEERTAQREKAASLKELQKELAAVKATKKASGGNKRSRIKAAPAESSSYMPTHMALAGLPQAEPLEASAWPALPEPAPSQDASMLMDYSAQLYQQWGAGGDEFFTADLFNMDLAGGAGPSGSSDDLAWLLTWKRYLSQRSEYLSETEPEARDAGPRPGSARHVVSHFHREERKCDTVSHFRAGVALPKAVCRVASCHSSAVDAICVRRRYLRWGKRICVVVGVFALKQVICKVVAKAWCLPAHRKALTRLLLSDHILAVEVLRRPARYRRAVLAREDRLCRLCRLHVEDEVHALLDCRGRLDLICMRRTLFEDMHRMKVRAPAFDGENWGRSFLCWLTGQKRDDVRAAWAHYVYRVLGVFEAVPIYVMDQYRLHSTTR
ncbi:hypothetical protein GGF50DRAFT_92814, partial [Schizophyllum commune]